MPDTRKPREGRSTRTVQTVIIETWGGWPWIGRCDDCRVQSPGQRTRDEAQEWVASHLHTQHDLS
jgi:hypothetical protein